MAKAIQKYTYVEKKATTCGGEPVITGTRIPVRIVYQRANSGSTIEHIRESYPHLTSAQIKDALSYCNDHLDEINGYICEEEAVYCRKRP